MPTNPALIASALTQDQRAIRMRLSNLREIDTNVLIPQYVSGTEAMNGTLQICVAAVSIHAGLELKQFIANPVELQFVTDGGALRSVCGVVTGAAEGHSDGGLATYQLTISDALALLDKTCNTRVFHHVSEVEITEILLKEFRVANPVAQRAFSYDLSSLREYPKRTFTMQYNESTAAFLRRLWKRRGISWFIQAGSAFARGADDTPAHTLVLFDDSRKLKKSDPPTMRFHHDSSTAGGDSITTWRAERTLTAGVLTRRSLDYKQAWSMGSQEFGMNDQGTLGNRVAASLDHYLVDVPHAGDSSADYRSLAVARIERQEYEAKRFEGESTIRDLFVGQYKRLTGHPEVDRHEQAQRDFTITELHFVTTNNLPKVLGEHVRQLFALNHWNEAVRSLEQASAGRGMRYANRFTCVRRATPIVPAYDPRVDLPRTDVQYVTVVGPENEEIHCDELGRIKIRFATCRPEDHAHAHGAGASNSERDSGWVLLSSHWAGPAFGSLSLPRAGDMMLCTFVGGDPDKPLIIGRVHGGKTPPPSFSRVSHLPADRYLSGIVSKEGGTHRYNQLCMDDTPGQISAKLGSAHADSQLILGYLTTPRSGGKASARGEGFELSTSESGAIRSAKSLLISAWQRLEDAAHLSSEGHLALMQECLDLYKSLGQFAADHQGGAGDAAPQAALKADLDGQIKDAKPTLTLTALAGIAVSTPKTIVSYAGMNVDTVAQQHIQLTSGQRLHLNAGKGISMFSHWDGIRQIAHHGKFLMQSQHDDTEINSAKNIKITATAGIASVVAKEIHFIAEDGSFVKIGGGVTLGSNGDIKHQAASFPFSGPATMHAELPTFSGATPDQKFVLKYGQHAEGGIIAPNRGYEIDMSDGSTVKGIADALGNTSLLARDAMHIANIRILADKE